MQLKPHLLSNFQHLLNPFLSQFCTVNCDPWPISLAAGKPWTKSMPHSALQPPLVTSCSQPCFGLAVHTTCDNLDHTVLAIDCSMLDSMFMPGTFPKLLSGPYFTWIYRQNVSSMTLGSNSLSEMYLFLFTAMAVWNLREKKAN